MGRNAIERIAFQDAFLPGMQAGASVPLPQVLLGSQSQGIAAAVLEKGLGRRQPWVMVAVKCSRQAGRKASRLRRAF